MNVGMNVLNVGDSAAAASKVAASARASGGTSSDETPCIGASAAASS
eukprot:CAMPEP_0204086922 /NCGR_PEP_ID=MMETSP0360-20130528/183789_1 /ASSEMBLY_ACC=CAM_ASM_000342 /TAXON_ID=268821 /ORGANISM="Scrippsiella Hangoei, Strain SHTV-5" /LENGTH=46 /DNA_ID= /DNA_START= /DNA_END= /DNA_ORIENTATION=